MRIATDFYPPLTKREAGVTSLGSSWEDDEFAWAYLTPEEEAQLAREWDALRTGVVNRQDVELP